MRSRDTAELVTLAGLWGASFLFMRLAVPEFGPVVLIQLRVTIAAMFLLPICVACGDIEGLKTHWKKVAATGVLNSALPFCLLAYATLHVAGGFAAILNATAPLWTALIAWAWLSERLGGSRVVGMLIGFSGVVVLVFGKVRLELDGQSLAIFAAVLASAFYGIGANYTRRHLTGVDPLAIATGSQLAAAVVLLPCSVPLWPDNPVSPAAWASVLAMGIASTGLAYILYFRLIANVGPARAITVTYLVPLFAVLWGAIFIAERLTPAMVAGCTVILTGTALATGVLSHSRKTESAMAPCAESN